MSYTNILAYVEKHVINILITICAQPIGIQGVKLVKSITRPDYLSYPSRAQDREDQCVKITYLKEQLRQKLEQNQQGSYDWKQTELLSSLTNDFIDLLGSKNYYEEVLMWCKERLKQELENPLLDSENDEINVSREQRSQQNVIMTTSLENSLLVQEDPIW